MTTLNEADVEQAALDWLEESGWRVTHGREIAPGLSGAERSDYGQVFLERLRDIILPRLISGEAPVGETAKATARDTLLPKKLACGS